MNKDLMFSSKDTTWSTPQWLFDRLDMSFFFDIDVCATADNAKCEKYFTPEMDGLSQVWNGTCFMNPPYGNPEFPCKPDCKKKKCVERGYHIDKYVPGIEDWVKKAYHEAVINRNGMVVALLPARTDTKWFHDYIYNKPETHIVFLKGRLKFNDGGIPAPFPSMIVVFDGGLITNNEAWNRMLQKQP